MSPATKKRQQIERQELELTRKEYKALRRQLKAAELGLSMAEYVARQSQNSPPDFVDEDAWEKDRKERALECWELQGGDPADFEDWWESFGKHH